MLEPHRDAQAGGILQGRGLGDSSSSTPAVRLRMGVCHGGSGAARHRCSEAPALRRRESPSLQGHCKIDLAGAEEQHAKMR